MMENSARLLRLLSLLRSRPDWSGPDLAEQLGVSPRTVRRDVERLREAGHPVHASTGASGGYRLVRGASLPPLLLDDDEAVAVVVGLRTAAGGTVAGIEETSVRALAKLEQVLPARLRHRAGALGEVTVALPVRGETVAPDDLAAIAAACRSSHTLRFDYRTHDGAERTRTAQPHRLACTGRRWYLLAWDVERADWRTYRVDRIRLHASAGPPFTPRELPDPDVAAYISAGISTRAFTHHAVVVLHAPLEVAASVVGAAEGVLEAIDAETCRLTTGASSIDALAIHIAFMDLDFEVESPPELADRVRRLGRRWTRAAG
ncbi:helix-turn-helix transcriptional regulator [Embleya sp. NBC_00896]|uniref:helix-turn-helix transcriptional regulator n=1 Tax=Embleya sp. NBC_00896 TaxID=2975961 RepID=UPI00386D4DFA|nr:WYL domain-containing protein [Embleya sp. NBC_00896]